MQIVYISNRPSIFAETVEHVALFMEFIESVVVCVPDQLQAGFEAIQSKLPISVIPESQIFEESERANLPLLDHQRRNYLLRTQLTRSDKVDDRFIMSDDDARPLKPIDIETFIKEGRYRRYYFYDLAEWDNNQTEFDAGQIATFAVLNIEGLPHLSYASHMPQVIDKNLFIQAADFFSDHKDNHPLCEWSTYFNYAGYRYLDRFHTPEAYLTLCWPEHPLAWTCFVKPTNFCFENVTPALYQQRIFNKAKALASEDSAHSHSRKNTQKIIAWRKYIIACFYPEQKRGLLKYFLPRVWVNKLFKNQTNK